MKKTKNINLVLTLGSNKKLILEGDFMENKICQACGRKMSYRKKWAASWHEVKYCSDKCRKNKNDPSLSQEILNFLKIRGRSKTICPSEILPPDLKKNKNQMERVRTAARLLVAEGLIEIVQNSKVVDPSSFRGPIRLRLK